MSTPLDHLSDLAPLFLRSFAHMSREQQANMLLAYADNLTDFSAETVGAACAGLARTEEWFPTLAKIRERCAELVLQLPSEDEALRQIEVRIAWVQPTNTDWSPEDPPEVHPLVAQVFNLIGGYSAWRYSEDPAVLRGQFGRLYREARAREVRSYQVGQPVLDAGPEIKVLDWPQRRS